MGRLVPIHEDGFLPSHLFGLPSAVGNNCFSLLLCSAFLNQITIYYQLPATQVVISIFNDTRGGGIVAISCQVLFHKVFMILHRKLPA